MKENLPRIDPHAIPPTVMEALRESEHNLRLALRKSPVALAAMDRELRYTWAYNMELGEPIDPVGKTDEELFPEQARRLKALESTVLETGVEARERLSVIRCGRSFFLDFHIRPRTDDVGRVDGLWVIIIDLTKTERVGEALHESEERYQAIFENMLDGFAHCQMLYDNDGRPSDFKYLAVNEAFQRLTGLKDVVGKKATEVFPDIRDSAPQLFRIYDEVARGGVPQRFTLDFAPLSKSLAISVSSCAEGYLSHLVRDITEQKRVETELKRSEERFRKLALGSERLYREQRNIAEQLQRALLHIPEEIGPIRLEHVYHSATKTARIGGDFYDVFGTKNEGIGILIGDVCGHGIEAARTATLVKDVVHAFSHQYRLPRAVLAKTNELLLEKRSPRFVTVFFAVLEPQSGVVRYASAGHPPPVLVGHNGEMEFLSTGSGPLGVFPHTSWRDYEVRPRPGDVLLLYTDGVTEARNGAQFFGESGLTEAIRGWKLGSPGELPRFLLAAILAFSQGCLTDDVAMLAVRLSPAKAASEREGRHRCVQRPWLQ